MANMSKEAAQAMLAEQRAASERRRQAAAARFDDGLAAVRRLVNIAKGDTGQSRTVANFLLAWWNAGSCGGFDLTDLWAVDGEIADDMVAVALLAPHDVHPEDGAAAEAEIAAEMARKRVRTANATAEVTPR